MNGIDLTDLVIDAEKIVGKVVLLKAAYATFEYQDGIPTAKRDGTRYRVATPVGTLNVKVKGEQTIDFDPDNGPVPVSFEALNLYVYYKNGKAGVAGRAKAIEVVDKGS